MVTGSSGYVANYIIINLAKKYPQATVIGMSRSGKPRNQSAISSLKNIEYLAGNCLEPESFKDALQDVDGCIHTVGTLIENKKNPQLTYQAMNADTAINMARELNATVKEEKKNFVMISSAKPPPFLPEYITTKQQGEQFLFNECPQLVPYILRPGFIYNSEHRGWSIPLMYGVDLAWYMNENVGKKLPFHSSVDFLFPAKSTKLESVGHFAIEGAMGNLDPEQHKIVSPEAFIEFEK